MISFITMSFQWLPLPLRILAGTVISAVLFVIIARIVIVVIDVVSTIVSGIKGLIAGIFFGG